MKKYDNYYCLEKCIILILLFLREQAILFTSSFICIFIH